MNEEQIINAFIFEPTPVDDLIWVNTTFLFILVFRTDKGWYSVMDG